MRAFLAILLLGCSRGVSTGAPDAPASPCDGMECTLYATPEAAFAHVLAERPAVLAVGETHAQRSFDGASTTTRFTETLLPLVAKTSKDLVLELWVGNSTCHGAQKRAMNHAAETGREIASSQSRKNPSEFIALYDAARKNGMTAHILVPPCDDYEKIVAAPDDVDAMLAIVARLSAAETESLLGAAPEPVVVYGGAMHNDLVPRPGHERWTFGPELDEKTGHRYVELDLIVPEMIRDTDAWRAQPWYPHFRASAQGASAVLFRPRPRSYALIFPPESKH